MKVQEIRNAWKKWFALSPAERKRLDEREYDADSAFVYRQITGGDGSPSPGQQAAINRYKPGCNGTRLPLPIQEVKASPVIPHAPLPVRFSSIEERLTALEDCLRKNRLFV